MLSVGSCNDVSNKAKFDGLGGELHDACNDYRIEMQSFNNDEINRVEELAMANGHGAGVDLQATVESIGEF